MNFYYIIHATQGDNAGVVEAANKSDALKRLNDIYAPNHPVTGKPHALVEVELVSEAKYTAEQKRIEKERKEEAGA